MSGVKTGAVTQQDADMAHTIIVEMFNNKSYAEDAVPNGAKALIQRAKENQAELQLFLGAASKVGLSSDQFRMARNAIGDLKNKNPNAAVDIDALPIGDGKTLGGWIKAAEQAAAAMAPAPAAVAAPAAAAAPAPTRQPDAVGVFDPDTYRNALEFLANANKKSVDEMRKANTTLDSFAPPLPIPAKPGAADSKAGGKQ